MNRFAAVIATLVLSGCATVTHGPIDRIPVSTDPAAAEVAVECGRAGRGPFTTPVVLELSPKADVCRIHVTKAGYQPQTIEFHGRPRPSVWWNIAPHALGIIHLMSQSDQTAGLVASASGIVAGIGFLIDGRSGALWTLEPKSVDVKLTRSSSP